VFDCGDFSILSSCISKTHERTITIGKPKKRIIITNFDVHVGNSNIGNNISTSCIIMKATTAYPIVVLVTFLSFNC
jgi:hypothetical protein